MERSARTIILLIIAFFMVLFACGALVFLLAGDQIVDFGRTAILQFTLSLREDDLNQPAGTDLTDVRFRVYEGDTPSVISQNLLAAGLIKDAGLFVDYVQAEGLDVELEAGKYLLNATMNIRQIAAALTDSRFSQITLTIVPGQRMEEIADAIDTYRYLDFTGQDFLNTVGKGAQVSPAFAELMGLPPGASLEGFLYPETYSLDLDVTAESLKNILLETFAKNVTPDMIRQAEAHDLTMYEAVTLASIVQREAIHNDEKALIAGVYLNRLNTGMRLEADPTVQYGAATSGQWWPRITSADYQGVISEYNTYRQFGLPPGPIASPALSSIQAVVNPQASEFFFFRADCRSDGYHTFATTFEEHLANGC